MSADFVDGVVWVSAHDFESTLREKYKLEKTDEISEDGCYRMWRTPSGRLIPIVNLKQGGSIPTTYYELVERLIRIVS